VAGSTEQWSRGGYYDAFMGRWSRRVADDFVTWVAADPGRRWVDVGSGTGALTSAIVTRARPSAVVGIDASTEYVDDARRRLPDPRVRFEVGDAHDLAAHETFDIAVSGLMLNFAADGERVVAAMRRAVAPDGVVAAYVWDYAGRMELLQHFWAAAATLDPSARDLDEAVRFAAWNANRLSTLWHEAGLNEVRTTGIDITCRLRDFDDYWLPFLGGQGPAATYLLSLDEQHRAALRDAVRTRLPMATDGSLRLPASAWAVLGTR
jgi:trans-aconitate methyltransferase